MSRLALTLAAATAAILGAGGAQAQTAAAGQGSDASPDVTVRAPERMVCRAPARTATRMRTSRICRTQQQWVEARAGRSQDEELAEAADTLEVLGEKISTGCVGGMPGNSGSGGPYRR